MKESKKGSGGPPSSWSVGGDIIKGLVGDNVAESQAIEVFHCGILGVILEVEICFARRKVC